MTQYLLTVDGSENSKRALLFYVAHLMKDNDKLTMLHIEHHVKTSILDPLGDNLDKITNIQEKEESNQLKNYFTKECEKLIKKNIVWEFKIVRGDDTGKTILNFIEIVPIDCIIAGSRGLNKLQRLVLGSVSNFLLHNSNKPVIVVP
ncbi:hypothetical protein DLAC_11717 [Tieghemostelium lacteum]|uniref:UspA domain-containing protein n=1 Tax=Tieghemostelium lacteum TaxID=361077 RepID=A0A151ZBY0_TIELA|nr:hypothetical protein DLAC_11717 [Tieghemostelium lacteum]|eukprot:KYQ91425.1 hypothetical protein DLAC_11717 [Tieghemostelium lacteum]